MYKKLKTHTSSRVFMQLLILGIASLVLLGIVAYDIGVGTLSVMLAAIGLVVGGVIGYVVGKIFNLAWHEETRKVVMSLDKMSFILIGVYVLFRIFGDQLLGHYVQGATLSALSFALLSGIFLGRVVSIWNGVNKILKQQKIW